VGLLKTKSSRLSKQAKVIERNKSEVLSKQCTTHVRFCIICCASQTWYIQGVGGIYLSACSYNVFQSTHESKSFTYTHQFIHGIFVVVI
jgi:hypothetical protein